MSAQNGSGGNALGWALGGGGLLALFGVGYAVKSSGDAARKADAREAQLRQEMAAREERLRLELESRNNSSTSTPPRTTSSGAPDLGAVLGGLAGDLLGGLFGGFFP
ncbi:hypothetical protein F0U59_26740 [Archangium gephyra]|nr:hypothetical protein F0U59_26740 [Archangium gephyra]